MDEEFGLQRFVTAQMPIYFLVLKELRSGKKVTHWMWFVFPQMKGLGHSWMAEKFGIQSLDEAREYLAHPVLGPRLMECSQLVNQIRGRTAHEIFGTPDDLKFRSSMTLFSVVSEPNSPFHNAIDKYYAGQSDQRTLEILQSE